MQFSQKNVLTDFQIGTPTYVGFSPNFHFCLSPHSWNWGWVCVCSSMTTVKWLKRKKKKENFSVRFHPYLFCPTHQWIYLKNNSNKTIIYQDYYPLSSDFGQFFFLLVLCPWKPFKKEFGNRLSASCAPLLFSSKN